MIVVIGIVILILIALLPGKKEEASHTYNAAFGDEDEYLNQWNKGFAITGDKALTKKDSYSNVACFGPTGSGKSSVVIFSSIKSLSRGKNSIIVNDVSGELEAVIPFLKVKGYSILLLDPANASRSESFNPLLLCKTTSEINKLALIIVRNAVGESKSDPFWENSSIMLIALMGKYLVFHTEPKYRTLQNVLRLVEKLAVDGTAVNKLFLKTKDEQLIDSYKAVLVMGEKVLQSVIATTRTALQLFTDDEVCKVTAANTIDFNCLRGDKPVLIHVRTPLKDLNYYKPLTSVFFQFLFDFILSRIPDKDERSVFFLIDEFATYKFPNITTTISNCRKFSAGILLCMQDEMSLISQYGQADAHQIKTNCSTQVYLKGQPLHTCKELSQILGRYTIIDEEGKEKGSRELMTPDEIRKCEDAIILMNNKPPLKCKTVPYFNNMWLSGLASRKPVDIKTKGIHNPSLIPFA